MRNLHLLIPHLRLSSYIDAKIAFQDEGNAGLVTLQHYAEPLTWQNQVSSRGLVFSCSKKEIHFAS